MTRFSYSKLAASNIKKNSKTYIPYILTCIGTVAMYFILYSLSTNQSLKTTYGGRQIVTILSLGMTVMAIFAVIFLFYTYSFLTKRRKKEIGLYNILGMEKRHISKIMFFETLFTSVISIVAGIVTGILLSKLFFLLLLKIVKFDSKYIDNANMQYEFSWSPIVASLTLFGMIFLLIFISTLRQIHLSSPIELLKGGNVGEREPKTKWVLTVVGLLLLSGGYFISLTTKNPMQVLPLFIFAVILVILGTYCLFVAGSIALLKALRKNKKFYYKTNNFTSVSGMIYRMKQNAVGLSNICILSTAVIVILSTTVSLYAGLDELIRTRYSRNIVTRFLEVSDEQAEVLDNTITDIISKYNVSAENILRSRTLDIGVNKHGNIITKPGEQESAYINFMPLNEYNLMTGKNEKLNSDEILVSQTKGSIDESELIIGNTKYKVKARVNDIEASDKQTGILFESYYFVVSDINIIQKISAELGKEDFNDLSYFYGFDLNSNVDDSVYSLIYNDLYVYVKNNELIGRVENAIDERTDFMGLYGGLLFIGLFLGLLFIMATVLIIYYKQISEGYDDKERFSIMKKVGMSNSEIKNTIRNQVVIVFFLPLITACIHVAFAFPIIVKLLGILNLTNVTLFIITTVGTIIIFAALYAIIYSLTARSYYKIVR